MKDLVEKLTSYNLFNYLLPGTVFSALADHLTAYNFIQPDLFVAFFVYYFTGLVISRIGSLALEPFLKKIRFVKFTPYEEFVRCSAKDKKLDVLSEANNSYRTLATVFLALAALKLVELFLGSWSASTWVAPVVMGLFLFALFLLSYRKQSSYITKRISANKE